MANYFCTDSVEEQVDYLTDKVKDIKNNKSDATNLKNGIGTGSLQQKGITYNELITDYEPSMAAWVIAKNGNTVPANVSVYLTALQNSTVPTSEQVVDILNNRKNDVNAVITNFKTLPSPYESYGIDSLIAGALAGYGLTSSSDLSNIVGKAGSAAAILGAMNKAFSPGAFAGGVGCEAGDEGYPGNSVCAFSFGSNVKTKGICSVGFGRDLENSGDTSAVFGRGNKEYKIDGETEGDKQNQRIYLDNLAEAGGTVNGTGDDRVGVTGINKGTNNFMAGNSHYIGEGAYNNAVLGNQNIIGEKDGDSDTANNFISGLINYIGLSQFCGIIGNRNQIRNSENIFLAGHSLLANGRYYKTVVGRFNDDKANTYFEVGNGVNGVRRNAFEVLKDGRAKVQSAPTEDDDVVRKLELNNRLTKPTNPSAESAVTMLADGTVGTKLLSEIGGGGGGKLYRHRIVAGLTTEQGFIYIDIINTSNTEITENQQFRTYIGDGTVACFAGRYGYGTVSVSFNIITNEYGIRGAVSGSQNPGTGYYLNITDTFKTFTDTYIEL